MPRPSLLLSPEEEHLLFSSEDGALQMVISYFEDWSSRQAAMLVDARRIIDLAKVAVPDASSVTDAPTPRACLPLGKAHQDSMKEEDFSPSDALKAMSSTSDLDAIQGASTPQTQVLSRRASMEDEDLEKRATSRFTMVEAAPPMLPQRLSRVANYLNATADALLEVNPLPSGLLARFIRGRPFEMFFVGVILANVLVIILATDNQIQNALTGQTNKEDVFGALDSVFAYLYAFELACRLYAYRLRFLLTMDWRWNVLDTFLTIIAIEDLLVDVIAHDGKNNLNFLRLMRLLKLLKTLRLFRILRSFRELRTMLNSIVGSIYVMAYAIVLIIMVMFAFGIFLSQGVGLYLAESDHNDIRSRDLLVYYWGSVGVSMTSAYMAVLGGENWRAMADSLLVVGEGFRLAFFAFVAFFLLVIVNTVTSVFVESAIQAGEKDSQAQIKEEMGKIQTYVAQFKDVFKRMDQNNDGVVDLDELLDALDRQEMIALMSKLMIDVHDAKQFLQEVFIEGKDNIDLDAFVAQCLKIRGPARSIDLISFAAAQQHANCAILNELSTLRMRNDAIAKMFFRS